MFGIIFYDILFFGVPALLIAFFLVSLNKYRAAKERCAQDPTPSNQQELRKRKRLLSLASVIAGVLVAVVIGFIILLGMSIAYM